MAKWVPMAHSPVLGGIVRDPDVMLRDEDDYTLAVPKRADFDGIAILQATAFQEKAPCCLGPVNFFCPPCCATFGQVHRCKHAYNVYAERYPEKLQHCRVVRGATGELLGVIQLTLPGGARNLDQNSCMRHTLLEGEAYVDWIACAAAARGKGIGSKLLAWADEEAKAAGAKFISLDVMGSNTGARRLYERKGYDVKPLGSCEEALSPPIVFCCFGCRYCSVKHMEKRWSEASPLDRDTDFAPPPGVAPPPSRV